MDSVSVPIYLPVPPHRSGEEAIRRERIIRYTERALAGIGGFFIGVICQLVYTSWALRQDSG